MSTVTNIVNQLLIEDEKNIINSPDKAYDALRNKALFEAPSPRLKRCLCRLLNEDEENLEAVLTESYSKFKLAQGKPFHKATVQKWLRNNTVPQRETVFEICFSLQEKLNSVSAVKELLTSGFAEHGFNVRSAKECIFLYCFASGKDYGDARRILELYNQAEAKAGVYQIESTDSGDTTLLLRRGLYNEWDTEEAFLEFLIQNKPLFIECSKSFVREYEKLYVQISPKVRLFNAETEYKRALDIESYFRVFRREASEAVADNAEISQLYDDYCKLKRNVYKGIVLEDKLKEYFADSQRILTAFWEQTVLPQVKANKAIVSGDQLELFITRGIPRIRHKNRSNNYNSGKQRNSPHKKYALTNRQRNSNPERMGVKNSKLYISKAYGFMAEFPQGGDFLLPNKMQELAENLSAKKHFDAAHYRKLFLMMLYYNYFFSPLFSSGNSLDSPQEPDFRGFVREVTETLYRCNLAPLYRNDYFDWLILNSAAAVANGCTPSSTFDNADDSVDSEVQELLDRISAHMDDYDPLSPIVQIISTATDRQVEYLYQCLMGGETADPDTSKEELIAAIEDDEDETVFDELMDLVDNEMGTYEDALTEIGNNPVDFFGEVLKMSFRL